MAELWDSRDLDRAEHIVEHARRSIRDIAGTAAYDALEGAFLDRDRPPLIRPDARAWTLAECLSSVLLLRMLGNTEEPSGDSVPVVPSGTDDRVRVVVLGAVAELRTLVLSALLKDPDLFEALARSRAEAPSVTPLDSLLWIIASYEAEDGGIGT